MKIIQISATPDTLYALTDEGKVYCNYEWGKWVEVPPIENKIEIITQDTK